jgi:hypothetical protein
MSRTTTLISRATVLSLLVAALAGMSAVSEARAALGPTTYYVSWPAGDCWSDQQGGHMQVEAPQLVAPSAKDTRIAWRAQLWQYTTSGWVKDIPSVWHWADVVNGVVYGPQGDSAGFSINRRGTYAITGEIYSYGLGDYRRDINLKMDIHTPFEVITTPWCAFS